MLCLGPQDASGSTNIGSLLCIEFGQVRFEALPQQRADFMPSASRNAVLREVEGIEIPFLDMPNVVNNVRNITNF